MFTIDGKFNSAEVYAEGLESSAVGQIIAICNQEVYKDSKIKLMPDAHPGKGCTVGTTMTIGDRVTPNLCGVDLSCGMLVVKLDADRIDFNKLDKVIRENIPSGFSIRKNLHRFSREISLQELCVFNHVDRAKAHLSIGTLGGGNHFIEIDQDSDGKYYLVIHSGSRHLGLEVAEKYQKMAGGYRERGVPYELASLSPEDTEKYIHDCQIIDSYANLNRLAMSDEILKGMKWKKVDSFTTTHNYIDIENRILRKGAISAQKDEIVIIPMNMRDGSLICRGKGNPDWNYSAPHGAGRICGRGDARSKFTLTQFKDEMKNVFSSCICRGTIDESPMAYKPMEMIIKLIEPTVEIIKKIKPVYNFKAGGK